MVTRAGNDREENPLWPIRTSALLSQLTREAQRSRLRKWLREASDLNPVIVDALLAKGSRPRTTVVNQDLLVFLRGVNLNPGQDPVRMVSTRMYATSNRIISIRRQHTMATDDLQAALKDGAGPTSSGEFLVRVADALTDRMGPKLTELKDELDQLEAEMEKTAYAPYRPRLASIQREAITLRRYLAPQRDALSYLCSTEVEWLSGADRMHLYENIDQITRYVENLDAGQEEALVLHEQISASLSEEMNRTMYLLSLLAAIFLPLDFLTGLLGVNLGGIPGTGNPWGFMVLTAGLVVVGAILFGLFRRYRWLRPIRRVS